MLAETKSYSHIEESVSRIYCKSLKDPTKSISSRITSWSNGGGMVEVQIYRTNWNRLDSKWSIDYASITWFQSYQKDSLSFNDSYFWEWDNKNENKDILLYKKHVVCANLKWR